MNQDIDSLPRVQMSRIAHRERVRRRRSGSPDVLFGRPVGHDENTVAGPVPRREILSQTSGDRHVRRGALPYAPVTTIEPRELETGGRKAGIAQQSRHLLAHDAGNTMSLVNQRGATPVWQLQQERRQAKVPGEDHTRRGARQPRRFQEKAGPPCRRAASAADRANAKTRLWRQSIERERITRRSGRVWADDQRHVVAPGGQCVARAG